MQSSIGSRPTLTVSLARVAPLFTQLLPSPASVDADELPRELGTDPISRHGDRPHTIANFATTADGAIAFEGRSGALGDDGDRAIFHALREQVDAVLAGTNTLRERALRPDRPERGAPRGTRAAPAAAPEPLACVISRSGNLPLEIPLFAEPEARDRRLLAARARPQRRPRAGRGRTHRSCSAAPTDVPRWHAASRLRRRLAALRGRADALLGAAARAARRRAVPDAHAEARRRRQRSDADGPSPLWASSRRCRSSGCSLAGDDSLLPALPARDPRAAST